MVPKNENENIRLGSPLHRRSFLGGSIAAAVAATSLGGATTADAATSTGLKAGAGRAAIDIPSSLLPLDGFTTVHDDLYVRILLLENGSRRVALAVLDLTSISAEAIAAMRTTIAKASGVAAADIVVTVTHTFSAPHVQAVGSSTAAAQYVQQITQATSTAITAAVAGLQPARVGFGTGECDVNVNRDVLTADGWWLGTGERGSSDKSVGVTRFDDLDGNPIAILMNYSVQSSVMMESVMANGDLPITADLAGAAVQHLEKQYDGDVVGFFLVGSCGDQSPAFRSKRYTIDKDKKWSQVDAQDAGWLLLTVQGERLGTEAVRVSETIKTSGGDSGSTVRLLTDSVTVATMTSGHPTGPTKTYDFTPTGTTDVPIWILQVGNGAFVGVEPELSTDTALAIKKHSPFPHTAVMSMLEGGSKNMAEAQSYARITYEAMDSSYAQGAAETVAAKIGTMLHSLRG
ncbi:MULTISPECIES: hypothetical protein [unclassified Streptomyces]|uniref:hypothetical protein n=1 Tax=unclassified Streptomyces TaxID=2593676 RepID=UPI002E81D779|nr:hypothetical protein [Streptomyces sp. NBC_00589]WTI34568.1 hypothetical protein OIC96_05965 [Streptomyces sp. NBC_00775]WUB31760.1 hypothetical protein OHA51_43765 [Streptomyces sp. NBC_00589]